MHWWINWVDTRWTVGHYWLIFYSRYYTVVWQTLLWGTVLSIIAGQHSTTTWESADNNRSSFQFPGTNRRTVKGRLNQSPIIGCGCYYDFAEDHEAYRHCYARCCQTNCSSSSSSTLSWESSSSPLLLAAPPLVFVRCGRPVSYSLDYFSRYLIALFVPSCICHFLVVLICFIIHIILQLAILSHRTLTLCYNLRACRDW